MSNEYSLTEWTKLGDREHEIEVNGPDAEKVLWLYRGTMREDERSHDFAGCLTRHGQRVRVDFNNGRAEEYNPLAGEWVEIEATFGDRPA